MLTGWQHYLLGNNELCWIFDIIYAVLPLLLTIAVYKDLPGKVSIAIVTAIFTLVYGTFLSAVSYTSPEMFIGFILIPLLFTATSAKGFYYLLHCMRYLFILVFVSAGFWKIKETGIFNLEEMAGILLLQHNMYIVSNPADLFSKVIFYLVQHPMIAYVFYFLAASAELTFAMGLFTKKYDKVLIVLLCLFILFDFLLMRINYFPWIVFAGCFYFSRYKLDKYNKNN
jgi:hypothetical protein